VYLALVAEPEVRALDLPARQRSYGDGGAWDRELRVDAGLEPGPLDLHDVHLAVVMDQALVLDLAHADDPEAPTGREIVAKRDVFACRAFLAWCALDVLAPHVSVCGAYQRDRGRAVLVLNKPV